jgi:anti-sigma B factor antagonist
VKSIAGVQVEWHPETAVAALAGEVDAANAEQLGLELRSGVTNRSPGLIVDLTALRYLDSAGINLLFALGDELRGRQQTLRLVVGATTPIARMLAITSLDRTHPTHHTVADAVAAARLSSTAQ